MNDGDKKTWESMMGEKKNRLKRVKWTFPWRMSQVLKEEKRSV